jgi:branched-chain amino acid transport system permease protein
MLAQQFVNGVALGSIYALVALGFTMVYGLLFFINLPHGEVMMLGTFMALLFLMSGLHPALALVLAMLLTGVLGVLVEWLVYRRLRHARRLAPLLSALGLVLVFQNGVMLLVGPQEKAFPPVFGSTVLTLGEVRVPPTIVVTIGVALTLMVLLHLFSTRTTIGIAIRGTSQDMEAAALVGINVNTIVMVTFAIGSALAAAGGFLLAARYGSVYANMGFPVMLKAFAACVLGGIGRIPGAVLGGLIIGISEVLVAAYLSASYQHAVAFAILVAILLVRPTGLLGGRTEIRV